jgi:DNA-binding CsgD family transcriptional regulator/tetratricopeptide (TPR) repeat protein
VEAPPLPPGLLERDGNLDALAGLLTAVRASAEGRMAVLGGEAGVGKTALLEAFCTAHARSGEVLWGACEPLRTPRPLGPFVDIAEALGGELERLVTSGGRPYEVAAQLMRDLRERRMSVVVVEDVHWADEATLDVITMLGRRAESVPALIVVSYRDDRLDRFDQLRYVTGELVRRSGRITVNPLSPDAVAALAAPLGVDARELYRTTGGNPFFVTEVLAAGEESIPETVRDAVLARAAHLSGPARNLLDTMAIVPGQVEIVLLEALAGAELEEGIEECLASGILTAGPTDVGFRHELARLAIEQAMPPSRRVALHRAAIAALIDRGGDHPDAAQLAHHAESAGEADGVLRWAPRAAELAAGAGAHREAAAHYARALRFADGLTLEARAELLHARAEECRLGAQFDEATEATEQELEARRILGDRLREGDALRSLSRLRFFACRADEGEQLAREAVELLQQLPPGRELAMAYANLSQRRMVVEDIDRAVAWGDRALALAEDLDDREVVAYTLTNIGGAKLRARRSDAHQVLARAREIAVEEGLVDYVGRVHSMMVIEGTRQRDYPLVDAHLGVGLDYCVEHGLETWRSYLVAQRARGELDRGLWDAAGESALEVLRDPSSAPVARVWALPTLGRLRVRRGDAEADAPLAEAWPLAEPTHELMQIVPVAAARAEAAWLAGDRAAVERATDDTLALALDWHMVWDAGELAYWRWRAGVHDDVPPDLVAEPYRSSLAGDWAGAAHHWDRLGIPYEAALARGDGDDPEAVRRAIDELQRLGARPAAALVARGTRERGVRGVPRGPRAQTRENPAGLTARELEVVALLAEGLRNAEIAERLVVSGKTVDHHVSAILRKLDARTRQEAAAAAARLGLTDR